LSRDDKKRKLRAADKNSATFEPMNKENINSDDAKLSALLRASRVSPALPPRFQEAVWRRIEGAEVPVKSDSWLDALAALVLRPSWALATVAALMVAGALLGVYNGTQAASQEAQAQYLAAVAPAALR
jgi:cell division protein FtsX